MSQLLQQHLSRIRTATTSKLGRGDIARWIEQNTYINGRNFSFKDHEYQERILTDPSPELVIRKSAQTGISEMSMRMSVALVMVMPGSFRVGYTLPTATAVASTLTTLAKLQTDVYTSERLKKVEQVLTKVLQTLPMEQQEAFLAAYEGALGVVG